jgi:nicotinamide-nucleotide adenylyltransferase
MQNEIIAGINEEDIKFLHSGQIAKYVFPIDRNEAHKKKKPHLIIRIFVIAIAGNGEIKYLVQKRSKKKEDFPEFFTDTASGHVIYKKGLKLNDIKANAKRELYEEFGIEDEKLKKIKFYDLKSDTHKNTLEIAYVFIGLVDPDVEIHPDPSELDVNESKFYTKTELKELLSTQKSIDYSREIWQKLIKMDLVSFFTSDTADIKFKNRYDKIALFIGRFQPLHHGHIYVLKKLFKRHRKVKIGIGSSQLSHTTNDPFEKEERTQFIMAALQKRNISPDHFEIYFIPDIFNANKWVSHVHSIVGDIDIVYSNSDWIRNLFSKAGFEIGEKMEIFKNKYNGSHIRNLISKNQQKWKELVPKEVIDLMIKFNGIDRIKR